MLDDENCPRLIDEIVSHLLWADDLILLALDPSTLQKQLDILDQYCKDWGLDINLTKRKLMIFNSKYSNHSATHNFHIGSMSLQEVELYCYLGIDIHNSGSFSHARSSLKKKAMRALSGGTQH